MKISVVLLVVRPLERRRSVNVTHTIGLGKMMISAKNSASNLRMEVTSLKPNASLLATKRNAVSRNVCWIIEYVVTPPMINS